MVHVAGAGIGAVWILEVEAVIASLDLVEGDAPGECVFLALAFLPRFAPPLFLGVIKSYNKTKPGLVLL
jgi:hypothetical protein